jgi:hypothetical protein
MTQTEGGIAYPSRMEVETSTDGITFAPLGSMDNPYADQTIYSKAYLWAGNAAPVTARYVRIKLQHRGWWIFVSELEVYSGS